MDFVAQTSERSGLMLRHLGQRLLTHLDAVSAAPVAPSADGIYAAPPRSDHQELAWPVFPLGQTPEDVRSTVLSFLPARELSSIRRVSRGFLQTADLHAETLWGRLCHHDFPSMAPPPTGAGGLGRALLSPHQASSYDRRLAVSGVVY